MLPTVLPRLVTCWQGACHTAHCKCAHCLKRNALESAIPALHATVKALDELIGEGGRGLLCTPRLDLAAKGAQPMRSARAEKPPPRYALPQGQMQGLGAERLVRRVVSVRPAQATTCCKCSTQELQPPPAASGKRSRHMSPLATQISKLSPAATARRHRPTSDQLSSFGRSPSPRRSCRPSTTPSLLAHQQLAWLEIPRQSAVTRRSASEKHGKNFRCGNSVSACENSAHPAPRESPLGCGLGSRKIDLLEQLNQKSPERLNAMRT
ncbi:hypothetical protein AB1Y20_014221 [Prymnesium parvum]|uniref:Uncharacterized protein n=1 Tax=Prymnesium parvum TaxID=97485 RepID=A0AB34IFL2_PRYPA